MIGRILGRDFMRRIWENLKVRRWILILGLGVAAVFAFFYLRYIFQTGIWYSDIFWKRSPGVNAGWQATVNGDDIELIRRVTDDEIEVTYRCNGVDEVYFVSEGKDPFSSVVTRDGAVVYDGSDLDVEVYAGGDVSEIRIPKLRLVAYIGLHPENRMRGNPACLIVFVFVSVILAIDLRFPDFFFQMRHFLTVKDPEPTEFYRMGQNFGRCGLVIAAVVCLILGASQ